MLDSMANKGLCNLSHINTKTDKLKSIVLKRINIILEKMGLHLSTKKDIEHLESKIAGYKYDLEVLGSQYDILSLKLDSALDRIGIAFEDKQNFLASMSHELRTPLNAIIGYAQIIDEDIDAEIYKDLKEFNENIISSGNNLLRMLNDILSYSNKQKGCYKLDIKEINIGCILNDLCNTFKPLCEKNSINIKCTFSNNQTFNSDENSIRKIFYTLISNAIKFTNKNENKNINIDLIVSEKDLVISVSDQGIGIKEGNFKKIFNPFWQVDQTTTRGYEGAGLGLALLHKIIELFGGDVNVQSELGVGSTFIVTIPNHLPEQTIK